MQYKTFMTKGRAFVTTVLCLMIRYNAIHTSLNYPHKIMKLSTTLACLLISNILLVNPVVAQIAPDNTLGDENSRVENRGNRDIINGG
ncbi:hypothetical protein GLO73106DRAFT_00034300, partial [Gloeocapsa sp. PCC 73106]